jgi:hypothetical protein
MLPPPTARNKQARQSNGGQGLKQALSIWDPLNPSPVPTTVSDGHAHINTGMDRKSFTLSPSDKAMLFVTNPGSSGLVGTMAKWSGSTIIWNTFVLPTLAGNAVSGNGPTAGRAMKASVSILNSTPARKVGGTVLTLNATQRIVWPTTANTNLSVTQIEALFAQIENQAQTRLHTGESFKTSQCMRCHPSNDVEYTGFRPFSPTEAGDDLDALASTKTPAQVSALADINRFLEVISTCTPYSGLNDVTSPYPAFHELQRRPMSTLCVLFDSPPEVQSYTISARGTYYSRWPLEHVLGQHHPPIPSAPAGVVSRLRDAGEHFKDMLHNAADSFIHSNMGGAGTGAFLTPSNAYSMYTQFQRARGAGTFGGLAIADIPLID